MAIATGDLEIDGKEEGLEAGAIGVGAAKGKGDAIVRPAKDVVEAG